METCGRCRDRLLDYLYDLLDASEQRSLEVHLDHCSACREALDQARGQQRLFASAARVEFPHVHFAIPQPQPAQPRPAVLPVKRQRLPWRSVAAAAAILLVIAGAGVPGAMIYSDYAAVRHEAAQGQAAVAQARRNLLDVHEERDRLARELEREEEDVRKAAADRGIQVVVSGHAAVQPGAPTRYKVKTRNLAEQPVPADLSFRVRDQDETLLHEEKDVASQGDYDLELPATLPVKPDTRLTLEVLARRSDGLQGQVEEKLSLASPVYVTHLTTDKPLYQPGDVVRYRSLTLERFSLKPPAEDLVLDYFLKMPDQRVVPLGQGLSQVAGEDGKALAGPDGKPIRGVGAGEVRLDDAIAAPLAGGEYALVVREANGRFLEQEQRFLVNSHSRPRLQKELQWNRKSYGPGDEVVAECQATVLGETGKRLAEHPVDVAVQVDGQSLDLGEQGRALKTDDQGTVTVRFRLPKHVERGEGTLSVTFRDGGPPEPLVKPIPIVLKTLVVDFYPEGGDLVAGSINKVYFQARTGPGRPADLRGRIVDDTGRLVLDGVETLVVPDQPGAGQGLGAFVFTPEADRTYELLIDSPIGIQGKYPLPKPVADGVVLHVAEGITSPSAPIRVKVTSMGGDRHLLVGAYCRGRLMDHEAVSVKKGVEAVVELNPSPTAGGVYRITVFEDRSKGGRRHELVPRAERLVYRQPHERLDLTVTADKASYLPGETVKLSLKAINERGEPAPTLALVSVVDRAVFSLANDETERAMPTHFYLTTEVRKPEDLEHADFLLSPHPRAREALDLLLGTQGWRRFAEQNPDEFRQRFREDADRLLVTIGQAEQRTFDGYQDKLTQLHRDFRDQAGALEEKQTEAERAYQTALEDPELAQAAAALERYENAGEALVRVGLPLSGGTLVVAGLVVILLAVGRVYRQARWLAVAVVGCSAVLLIGVVIALNQGGEVTTVAQGPIPETLTADPQAASKAREEVGGSAVGKDLKAVETQEIDPASPALPRAKSAHVNPVEKRKDTPEPQNAPEPKPQAPLPPTGFGSGTANATGGGFQSRPKADARGDSNRQTDKKMAETRGDEDAKRSGMANRDAAAPALDKLATKGAFFDDGKLEQMKQRQVPFKPDTQKLMPAYGLQLGDEREKGGATTYSKPLPDTRDGRPGTRKDSGLAVEGESVRARGPFVVRQYAHGFQALRGQAGLSAAPPALSYQPAAPGDTPASALPPGPAQPDFAETLFWHPALVLVNGQAHVNFRLCDSVTTFQVTVLGHTLDGRVGSATAYLDSRSPFTLLPHLPTEVTAGDRITVPLTVVNNTNGARQFLLGAQAEGFKVVEDDFIRRLNLEADKRTSQTIQLESTLRRGQARVEFFGDMPAFTPESIQRTVSVVPGGFPVARAQSDYLNGEVVQRFDLPENVIPGTLEWHVEVFPSTLAQLRRGLEGLKREPSGGFEPTASLNYLNVLILDELKASGQLNPRIEREARGQLARGFQQFQALEAEEKDQGKKITDRFLMDTDKAEQAYSALGLLKYRQLGRPPKLDETLYERNRQLLFDTEGLQEPLFKDGQLPRPIPRPQDPTRLAYTLWALTESGQDDVGRELNTLAETVKKTAAPSDPYLVALTTNTLLNRNQAAAAVPMLKELAAAQNADGRLEGAKASVTGSGGRDLQVETTALATLAWLKANRAGEFAQPITRAVQWLVRQRGPNGTFGATQATVLALKALAAHSRTEKRETRAGELRVYVGDTLVGRQRVQAGEQEAVAIHLGEVEKNLKPGTNRVRIELTGQDQAIPFTFSWSYRTSRKPSSDTAPVKLTTRLDRAVAAEGEIVRLDVGVNNASSQPQSMTVAVIGLPAGLALPEDLAQLRKHVEAGTLASFEVRGRDLVLYWRGLAAGQQVEVPVDLICRFRGEYRGPASRAYPFYEPDARTWLEPLGLTIR